MTVHPLFDPRDFRIPEGVSHVCAAGETAFLRRHDEAYGRYVRDKSSGARGRAAQEAQVERARQQVAALWGMPAGDIGWVGCVAEGVSLVLESIDWRAGASSPTRSAGSRRPDGQHDRSPGTCSGGPLAKLVDP